MKKAHLISTLLVVLAVACTPVSPASSTATLTPEPATPTPEIFIPLTQAVPARVQLNGVTLAVQEAHLGGCDLPDCPPAPAGTRYLRVTLQALNLPADQSLDYKDLPPGIAVHDNTDARTPFNRLSAYSPAVQQLTLYFAVPEAAEVFGLQWPGAAEIPLPVTVSETPTALPPTFEGVEVSVDRLTVVLPPGLTEGARGLEVPPAGSEGVAPWEATPGHIQLKLEGYRLQDTFHQAQIYLYPAQAYAEMRPAAFESIRRLDNILYGPGASVNDMELPSVPFFSAGPVFASNIKVIPFQNGSGVRVVTEYAQYAAPANNHDLFYHFQGVTRDGAYYVVAILPITAPGLAETSDPAAVLPPGGIVYPDFNDPNADWQGYYTAVTDLLNAVSSEAFSPALTQLDALIQSLRIAP